MPVNTSDATIYFLQIYGKRIERLIYCSSAALIKRLAKSGYNSENKEVHMEKEFTFETDYDISALSAMARALRKTVRKRQSRRSRIFGWTVAVLGILTTAALGINVVTLTAIVILVLFLLFEDRMNGYMAKKRVLPGTEHCRCQFYQDKFLSVTKVGKTEFRYDRIKYVAEDQRYFLFVLSNSHAQAYDKKRLTGGDAGEFRSFIEDRTGLKVIPVSGRF